MATKTFSEVKGGYRSNGTSITLVSNKVLSSTNPVRINSVTVSCGVGNAYGMMPYVSDTTTGKSISIGSYVNSAGSTVSMLPDGGWFFYPSSSTTISSSNLTKYTSGNYEYYRLSGYASNFVYADGASVNATVDVGDVGSSYETISNTVYAKYVKCGTVDGDSTKIVYGVTVGNGATSKTFSFNPDLSIIAAGEAVDVRLNCTSGNGVLCVPSGSTVTIDYTEIAVSNPSSGQATGTVTFVAPGSYTTQTTTISAETFWYYYNWEHVSFPASVPTISGSCDNYISSGYKYPSLQNIVSATIDGSNMGGFSFCVYNGELYCSLNGPDAYIGVIVTYRSGTGAFPGSITAFETGMYAQTITLNSPSTSYSLSSAASPEFIAGSNALVFPEISGWQLQVVPDNSPYGSIVKYATYTKIQSGSITVSGLSNNYNITYQTMGTKSENVYAIQNDTNKFSGWTYTTFGKSIKTTTGSASTYMTAGYEVPTTLTTVSNATITDPQSIMSCCIYNGKVYVEDVGPVHGNVYVTLTGTAPTIQTITKNGTYTFSNTVSNLTAMDITFNEPGNIEYLDNGNITIEFRKDRTVSILLVQQYESYMREPFVPTILTINFSNGQSQSITLNYNRNGPDMEAAGVATHTYINATVTSYYVFGKTYTTGITNGNDASISNVVELIDLGPWRQVIPYIYLNGQWVKYEDTRLYNNGWKKATWRIYSDAEVEVFEEEQNTYGTTGIISNYTTEQNSHGTTVVIG